VVGSSEKIKKGHAIKISSSFLIFLLKFWIKVGNFEDLLKIKKLK